MEKRDFDEDSRFSNASPLRKALLAVLAVSIITSGFYIYYAKQVEKQKHEMQQLIDVVKNNEFLKDLKPLAEIFISGKTEFQADELCEKTEKVYQDYKDLNFKNIDAQHYQSQFVETFKNMVFIYQTQKNTDKFAINYNQEISQLTNIVTMMQSDMEKQKELERDVVRGDLYYFTPLRYFPILSILNNFLVLLSIYLLIKRPYYWILDSLYICCTLFVTSLVLTLTFNPWYLLLNVFLFIYFGYLAIKANRLYNKDDDGTFLGRRE